MRHWIKLAALASAIAFGGMSGAAEAGVVITSAGNGGAPTGPSITVLTFDTAPLGVGTDVFPTGGPTVTLSFTGDGGVVNGDLVNKYAEPYPSLAGPDTTNYLSTGIGTATLSLSTPQTYFGLLWGSVDSYNSLAFYDAHGNLISSFTGLDVTAAANGDQGYYGTFYVNFLSDIPFTTVVASSSNYAFEFDDVAVDPPAPAPEPASLAILAGGLMALAATRRRVAGRGGLGHPHS